MQEQVAQAVIELYKLGIKTFVVNAKWARQIEGTFEQDERGYYVSGIADYRTAPVAGCYKVHPSDVRIDYPRTAKSWADNRVHVRTIRAEWNFDLPSIEGTLAYRHGISVNGTVWCKDELTFMIVDGNGYSTPVGANGVWPIVRR